MAAVSTIVAVAAVAVAGAAAYQQSRAAKAAAKDRKEAAAVSQAEQAAQQNQNRRAQVREERVRRASILQNSQNTGVSQSSGELGATSALGSLIGGNVAATSRQTRSAAGIGGAMQSAADQDLRGAQWGAIGSVAQSVFGFAAGARMNSGGGSAPTQVQPTFGTNASQGSIFNNMA